MPNRTGWSELLWGPVTLAIATVTLAIASAVGGSDRPWFWIVLSAGFIIVHTAVSAVRRQSIVRRLGRDYDRVQRRAVQVVADLGQLAADNFDLWMIDLYLPRWRFRVKKNWPFIARKRELSRQLSISLIDARPQPPTVDAVTGPHGQCFSVPVPLVWFNEEGHKQSIDNAWGSFDQQMNADLGKVYGVLSVSPLVDQLGKNCVGVLAIHVEPDAEKALRARGALRSAEGRRRINNACVELNGLLSR